VVEMDSLEIFFSVVDHPLKIDLIKYIDEYEPQVSFCQIANHFSVDKTSIVKKMWELENDHIIIKIFDEEKVKFSLSTHGKRLVQIINRFNQWSIDHSLYGGI
jgi:DNA-binding HxlR family transcriptional regulator